MIKKLIKKFLPKEILLFYHKMLAVLAAFFYGWPSRKMIVIGVTGTAGKSTVVNLIGRILEEAGFKVGWTTTMNFKIAEKEWLNKTKMTMLGRFALQKFLKKMVQTGCQYAIIETSSEGILQSRHLGIDYDIAVFTGIHPEHLETHGSFEKYRQAKGELFKKLKIKNQKSKTSILRSSATAEDGQIKNKKISIVNLDDENADYFLSFKADEYYGYGIKNRELGIKDKELKIIKAEEIELKPDGSEFMIHDSRFKIHLLGKFNIYNALAAICVGLLQGVNLETCQKALEKIKGMPGRMEVVIEKPFKVIVDYAHTPQSLKEVYETLRISNFQFPISKQAPNSKFQKPKMICVLGSAGGGRDKWKRPVLGKLAAQYCDYIVLTNEDPYDENPLQILNEIESGFSSMSNVKCQMSKILDRREAIRKALSLAKADDIIIITGKGCEPWMCVANSKKIPWDDRKIVKELFNNLSTGNV